ncbi:hypothetical protein [Streptomyces malaysiensis]|nr:MULTISPECIES: hypothetical protein [Streptomyces]
MTNLSHLLAAPFHFIAAHPVVFGIAAVAMAVMAFTGPREN